MSSVNDLLKALKNQSKGSARSKQSAVGPSEIGGCRRRVWYRLNNQTATNETLQLASTMGTAIHKHIEEAIRKFDPMNETYVLESEWEAEGLRGHVDLYNKVNYEVVDWKTTTKKNLAYFPSKQQRWQVHLYGWLLEMNGLQVNTVTLVAIPRDGDERDIVFHSEPWNLQIAREALTWFDEIKKMAEAPAPEKEASFCELYCQFYDASGTKGCVGRPKDEGAELPLIEDDEFNTAARDYFETSYAIKELEKRLEQIKTSLEGTSGVTKDGIKVIWSNVSGRQTIDEEVVHKLLGYVPRKTGKESTRLSVKK